MSDERDSYFPLCSGDPIGASALLVEKDRELERLRAEVAALNQPVKLSEWQELVEERDRLRELLREIQPIAREEWGHWKKKWNATGSNLLERIEDALGEKDQPVVDEVATLESRIAGLRAALQKIAAIKNQMVGPDWEEIDQAREIAKAALGGDGK